VGFAVAGTGLLVAGGTVVAGMSGYLLTLSIAALASQRQRDGQTGDSRLVVVVPAFNEAELIGRCLTSLRVQTYPRELLRIVVVADNCTDDTATVAAAAGAEVLVRDAPDARGKGRALRWSFDQLSAEADPADAFIVVDADSVADPDLVGGLATEFAAGHEVVQAEYLVTAEPGTRSELRQAAFLLFHRTRFTGRARLGMACNLVGNGMLLSRSVLQRVPWGAFTGAEDLEYSIDLRLAGVKPRFARSARVFGPAPGAGRAAATQRMRWEGGRFHVVRTRLLTLLAGAFRRRDLSLLDAALDLAVPPLGLLGLISLAGAALASIGWAVGATSVWALLPWATAIVAMVAFVVVGLRAARAPASAYRALLQAPRFLLAKLGTYARMTRGLHAERWERTERPGEATLRAPGRVEVCGVPIDAVDATTAADRIIGAIGSGSLLQVATVNLQFLVNARRRPPVQRALRESQLNLADGAPVVWLARLVGQRLPGRVAGADLVPELMALAARRQARVFLLGGAGGVAVEAAAALTRRYPGLVISGTYEPPLTALDAMDDEAIRSRIAEAGADILLVALGHPKQDLWIARNRDSLPVAVAIGVGGTLDMVAGRVRRAPSWAREHGLEWFFRLAQEPTRLFARYVTCAVWLVAVLMPLAALQRIQRVPTAVTAMAVPAIETDQAA
jgi:1,2-diacylglycerol 3-beta-glucosyltransferase